MLRSWLGLVAGLLSIVLGPVVMTALLVGYHWLFERSLLSDGQYFFFLFITVPCGVVAGFSTVAAIDLRKRDQNQSARFCLIGGGIVLIPPVLYTLAVASNTTSFISALKEFPGNILTFLPILLVGSVLIAAGVLQKRKIAMIARH